ncbi:ABC transporter ATP-binding protein [Rhizobium oryzicola]|uniref:ABC transporter ATP-binding protein n=1 Tax=Rhizobium oryzicola TaxID=1232668 RepID=A0ABT8SY77_9HYPH|nr:ABC transporter ATP-binding protein [Rhizobium oryzicola]MDO1583235.1 ABC transporter ATP-binding protein [Rhizobium oryzicola]
MSAALLSLEGVHVAYGKVEAVRGVTLKLDEGQITTVIGANGAGKTTLLSAAAGLLPWSGRAQYRGQDLSRMTVEDRVERGFCLVPEQRALFGDMPVLDNLLLGAFVRRHDKAFVRKSLDAVFEQFPRLAERQTQLAQTLSGGERQMLAIGRALMSQPRLLLLDEPSLGLAPTIVRDVLKRVRGLRDQGVSILLVEQNARAALDVADYAYVMDTGEFVLEGAATDMANDERVMATYLGGRIE